MRRRTAGIIAAPIILLTGGIAAALAATNSTSDETLQFPDRLNGTSLVRYSDPQHVAAIFSKSVFSGRAADRRMSAVYWYNSPTLPLVAIAGITPPHALTRREEQSSVDATMSFLTVGSQQAPTTLPDPRGGVLECGDTGVGPACAWADKNTEAVVEFEVVDTPHPPSAAEIIATFQRIRAIIER
jgi:hypothetical protein